MSLVNNCGNDYALSELFKAVIGVVTATDVKFIKIVANSQSPFAFSGISETLYEQLFCCQV